MCRHALPMRLRAYHRTARRPGSETEAGHQGGWPRLAETTLGKLIAAIEADQILMAEIKEPAKLLDLALLWLHEQDVIRLNKGLAVFRPAMTIKLEQEKRGFAKTDFMQLVLHYAEQVIQIHVMAEYAQLGLKSMADALHLAMGYFSMDRDAFIKSWLPGRAKELAQQTTPASWRAIVESLNNPVQQRIVADDREQTNVLVLAGPGSGKTRVLVHRIAYLVRARRENPHGILALAYNRHAAVEIRRRLKDLIGDDARGVTVLTCHAFAMRLVGASFAGRADKVNGDTFKEIMQEAVALLQGTGLPPEEADEQRGRLLSGFRWILVDEYQDIGPDQYELISALAGRTLADEDGKLTLFAVGDDDQNIYAFDGASVEFIRRFETDYTAKPAFLTENYRSTGHIIAAANLVIDSSANRMKAGHPISIDRARLKEPPSGSWKQIDPITQGRVQILEAGANDRTQAMAVMAELVRLSTIDPVWDWAKAAVIAKEWKFLEPLRSYCEMHQIPVQMADEETAHFWRLRETQALVAWLQGSETRLVDTAGIIGWLNAQASGPWWTLLREAVDEYAIEAGSDELPIAHFIDWLAEWGREVRRRQTGLMLLTAHRAKGLEFDHVAVLDGSWSKVGKGEDQDAPRRLYYVAMTRARKTLTLARMAGSQNSLLVALSDDASTLHRAPVDLPNPPFELERRYVRSTLRDIDMGFSGRYWFYRALDEFVSTDMAEQQIGRPENHEANRLAYIRAMSTQLRLTEVYGVDETVNADSGARVNLFQALLSLELMSAFFQRDFLESFVQNLKESDHWVAALGQLALDGLMDGSQNRFPLTWSDREAKIANIVGWTVNADSPQGSPLVAAAILDFWTNDWVALSERLRKGESGLHPELIERPILKLGQLLVQLPWLVGLQNNSTAAINNLRRLGARRGEADGETRRIEERLGRLFAAQGFRVAVNWNPPAESYPNAGEVDLICARDGIVLVMEVKSTFLRRSQRDAWLHAATTLRKAGQQVSRKVSAVRRALSEEVELASSLGIYNLATPLTMHGWIVDTSIEYDHQRFGGFLKVSLEEVLIALRDDRHLLNDPDGIISGRHQDIESEKVNDVRQKMTLYPEGFSAARFIEVIETESVWDEKVIVQTVD